MKLSLIVPAVALASCSRNHAKNRAIKIWMNVEHCNNFRDVAQDGLGIALENLSIDSKSFLVGGALFGDRQLGGWDTDTCWWDVSQMTDYGTFISRFTKAGFHHCSDKYTYQESVNALTYAAGHFSQEKPANEIRFIVTVTDDMPAYEPYNFKVTPGGQRRPKNPEDAVACNSKYEYLKVGDIQYSLDKFDVIPITVTIPQAVDAWTKFYAEIGYPVSDNKAYIETMASEYKDYYTPGALSGAIQRGILNALLDLDNGRCL